MGEFQFDETLKLCHMVRNDLDHLLRSIHERELYDVSYKLGQSARSGIVFETVKKEFDELERLLADRDIRTLSEGNWCLCDLVNYYDHLLELIKTDSILAHKEDRHVQELMDWRNTAGKLCQNLCRADPDEDP